MDTDLNLPDLDRASAPPSLDQDHHVRSPKTAADLEQVLDVPVTVSAVLGKTRMEVSQLLKIAPGSSWSSTGASARRSTSTSTTGSSRAAKWSSWTRSSA